MKTLAQHQTDTLHHRLANHIEWQAKLFMATHPHLYRKVEPTENTFGPRHCKPMLTDNAVTRVQSVVDDGKPTVFEFIYQRGVLKPGMSALEISELIMGHVPYIIPLLSGHPRIQAELRAVYVLLATSKQEALDRLLPWIRVPSERERKDDNDVIILDLFARQPQESGRAFSTFVKGA